MNTRPAGGQCFVCVFVDKYIPNYFAEMETTADPVNYEQEEETRCYW